MRYIAIILMAAIWLVGCETQESNNVAAYGNYVLTQSEVRKMMPKDLEGKDSVAFVNELVDRWVKDKVLLQNSKEILSPEELDKIELKVQRYKEDITTSFIEEKLTENLIDSIPYSAIEAYYKEYSASFDLKEAYLQYRFMHIPADSAQGYKKLLRDQSYQVLQTKLETYGYPHDMRPDNWISKQQFLTSDFFPEELKKYNLYTKNQIFSVNQNSNVYILEVSDYKKAGETAPLVIVKDMIKSVLINKRKLNLLSEKKKELYKKALQNDEVKRK